MAPRVHEVLAAVRGRKAHAADTKARALRLLDPKLFHGQVKVYYPTVNEGEGSEEQPNDNVQVRQTGGGLLQMIANGYAPLLDVEATIDIANLKVHDANAVDVNSVRLLPPLPVATLLFIDRVLGELDEVVRQLPVLDAARAWRFHSQTIMEEAEETRKAVTRKVLDSIVLSPATPEHAAQVKPFSRDESVGYWLVRKLSGEVTQEKKDLVLQNILTLREAVMAAVARANSQEAWPASIGDTILSHVFDTQKNAADGDGNVDNFK